MLKWKQVSKANFYYEAGSVIIMQFLPIDSNANDAVGFSSAATGIIFIFSYVHWWPSLLISMSYTPIEYTGRAIFHEETFPFVACLNQMAFIAFLCWIIHICITKVGMIYIETNVLRMGNE